MRVIANMGTDRRQGGAERTAVNGFGGDARLDQDEGGSAPRPWSDPACPTYLIEDAVGGLLHARIKVEAW